MLLHEFPTTKIPHDKYVALINCIDPSKALDSQLPVGSTFPICKRLVEPSNISRWTRGIVLEVDVLYLTTRDVLQPDFDLFRNANSKSGFAAEIDDALLTFDTPCDSRLTLERITAVNYGRGMRAACEKSGQSDLVSDRTLDCVNDFVVF